MNCWTERYGKCVEDGLERPGRQARLLIRSVKCIRVCISTFGLKCLRMSFLVVKKDSGASHITKGDAGDLQISNGPKVYT